MVVIPGERSETRDPFLHSDTGAMGPGSPLRYGRDDKVWCVGAVSSRRGDTP